MMETKPTGLVLVLTGWLDHPAEPARRTLELLPEGCLMDGMNKLRALDAGVQSPQGCVDSIKSEPRATLVADGGSTREWTTVFCMGGKRKQFVKKFVSDQ